jgi:uncharacterized iron-regulated protein
MPPASRSRRGLLLAGGSAALAGCGVFRAEPAGQAFDTASGRPLGTDELLQRLRAAEFLLLGELHDNAAHHAARARLILALGPDLTVVAEQLDRGATVGPGADVRSRLVAAGFDEKGWRWPLHEALFAPLLAAQLPVVGGNASSAAVRRVAREGAGAWPPELQSWQPAADGLRGAALAALDQDLVDGHCGHLPPARLPAMRSAQALRDASMWQALVSAAGRRRVLVAGNGHVRRDYGVPRFAPPTARVLSVGFLEHGDPVQGVPYDAVWVSARAEREDPCAGMKPMR